jgi:predicted GTPase
MNTQYEGKEFKLTLCHSCWDCWYEHIMINGNRYRKVDNVSFLKKHEMSVVRDTLKNIMALQESRRLIELADKMEKEAIHVMPTEDEDTLHAEQLYRQAIERDKMKGKQ